MILPPAIIKEIIERLNEKKDDLKFEMVIEGSEDEKPDLVPPYIIVYEEFDQTTQVSDQGFAFNLPTTIGVACVSAEHATAAESFYEALTLAIESYKILVGDYEIEDKYTLLKSRDIPFRIGRKSAKISSVIINLTYDIDIII